MRNLEGFRAMEVPEKDLEKKSLKINDDLVDFDVCFKTDDYNEQEDLEETYDDCFKTEELEEQDDYGDCRLTGIEKLNRLKEELLETETYDDCFKTEELEEQDDYGDCGKTR